MFTKYNSIIAEFWQEGRIVLKYRKKIGKIKVDIDLLKCWWLQLNLLWKCQNFGRQILSFTFIITNDKELWGLHNIIENMKLLLLTISTKLTCIY